MRSIAAAPASGALTPATKPVEVDEVIGAHVDSIATRLPAERPRPHGVAVPFARPSLSHAEALGSGPALT